ncbi:MAG: hypothetical protein Q9166_005864, partial [cf. Caloplaca sp. 2 TL-2023]
MTTSKSSIELAAVDRTDAVTMPSEVKPEFFVSTYTASQFYQPLPPKWLKMKTHLPKNLDKPARESLKALETLADVRAKLGNFDTEQIDLLIDHKINLNAQFTPRNAFDYSEDFQLDRLSRLTEVRRKLEETEYGLASLDAVLKLSLDNLIMTTGISRAHSVCTFSVQDRFNADKLEFLTAQLPIVSFHTKDFTITSGGPMTSVELFFDDRTRQIRVYQGGKQFYWEGKEIKLALRDVWKATWAERSAKVCLHLFNTHESQYESCLMEMKATGDARGFLQKMSGIANFKVCRLE